MWTGYHFLTRISVTSASFQHVCFEYTNTSSATGCCLIAEPRCWKETNFTRLCRSLWLDRDLSLTFLSSRLRVQLVPCATSLEGKHFADSSHKNFWCRHTEQYLCNYADSNQVTASNWGSGAECELQQCIDLHWRRTFFWIPSATTGNSLWRQKGSYMFSHLSFSLVIKHWEVQWLKSLATITQLSQWVFCSLLHWHSFVLEEWAVMCRDM